MIRSDEMSPMLTVREVARLLHIHSNTVRWWNDQGRIRIYRITPRGDRRFRREDIVSFLSQESRVAKVRRGKSSCLT